MNNYGDEDPILQRAVAFEILRGLFQRYQEPHQTTEMQVVGRKLQKCLEDAFELAIKAEATEVLGFNPNPPAKGSN